MSRALVSLIVILFITLIGLLPILSIIGSTFVHEGSFSFDGYRTLFENKTLWRSFYHSITLAGVVAFFTTLVGTGLGILLGKTKLYGRYFWFILLIIPLLIPPYILAYALALILQDSSYLSSIYFGFTGTAWVLFSIYLPIPMLLTLLFLRHITPQLEEVALLYSSWREVLKNITLPLLYPAMALSFVFVFILSLGESSVATFLRYDIFPTQSFIQFSAFYDFNTATIYTMPLILIVLFILIAQYRWLPLKNTLKSTNYPILLIEIKREYLTLALLLPIIFLVSLLPLFGILEKINLQVFIKTLTDSAPMLLRSMLYASMGATLLVIFAFFSAYIIYYRSSKFSSFFNAMLLFFFVVSSVVLGIALIHFWNRPITNFIYATPVIILIGYLVKYLFLTTKIVEHSLSKIPYTLIEVAQLSGASWFQIVKTILIPLLKKSFMVAWVVGFIFTLRESTITMLVAPAGLSTLSSSILTQMANGKEATIASLCLLSILLVIVPLGLLIKGVPND